MQIAVITSDKTMWALRPLAYTFRVYWSVELDVLVGGYTVPPFELTPHYWRFRSLGDFSDYPSNKWSDGLIKFLDSMSDDLVLLHFDDFWLTRPVDHKAINIAQGYMNNHPNVARFDLTSDRLYAAGIKDIGNAGHLDLIEAPHDSPYNFSYQSAIWRRESLLSVIVPGESAGESEINSNARMMAKGYDVVGTRQIPLRYCVAVQHGKLAFDGGYMGAGHAMKTEDIEGIRRNGWIPDNLIGGYANV